MIMSDIRSGKIRLRKQMILSSYIIIYSCVSLVLIAYLEVQSPSPAPVKAGT